MDLQQPGLGLPKVAILLVGFFSAVYLSVCHMQSRWRRQAFCHSKGALPIKNYGSKDPIFGLDLMFANIRNAKNHCLLESQRARFVMAGSNTIQLRIGRGSHISTLEPENLKTIQATDFNKWALPDGRKRAFHPLLGKGIFTTDGPEWQRSRHILRSNFARDQVADIDMLEKHVSRLIGAIPRDPSVTVNLSDLFFRLTMDSATELLFGQSTDSLSKGSSEDFTAAFTEGQQYIMSRARLSFLSRLVLSEKKFARDVAFINTFVDRYVTKALSSKDARPTDRYTFMNELTKHTRDPVRVRSELLNVLLAGRDTTASLLTNVWWQLAQRDDIWTKLQEEVATLGGQHPTFAQLKNMYYLKAILNESLRLHPVVPLNSRQALEDTVLPVGGGYDGQAPILVPKGQRVVWNVYAMHRRKDIYGPDAEEFRPERWLDDKEPTQPGDQGVKNLRPGWGYLPFNGGARICLGQQYALTEAGYTTVRLCQAFKGLQNRGAVQWTEKLTLTCTNLDGAKVALTPR